MIQKPVCPDCSGNHLKLIGKLPESNEFSGNILEYHLEGGSLYSCLSCGLKFRFPVLAEEDYNRLYNTENTNWIFDENRNDWKILKSFVEEKISEGGKILDFGCNFGDVLARIPEKYMKFGIEINSRAAEIARTKINATICADFNELPAGSEFDLIFAIDVIEHLQSPKSFVLKSLPYLKNGGYIVLMTGDSNSFIAKMSGAKWYYSAFPEHIAFISKSWAEKLCKYNDNLEMFFFKNYAGTNKSFLKRLKWFSVWMVNFILRDKSKYLFRFLPKISETGMGEMKNFGKNFSADHLFVVFQKVDH
jgi:SAM-dependent methyltransferase